MTDTLFEELAQLQRAQGTEAAIGRLIDSLRDGKEFHRLFDALLLKTRYEMKLPLGRLTSLDDVPENQQQAFEEAYIEAARQVGGEFLAQNNIPQAWLYFRTIREPERVHQALEAIDPEGDLPENVDDLIGVALYDGAHPLKGLAMMLASRGTCNTITAFDQQMHQLAADDRARGAALLARNLYGDLCASVRREIERKEGTQPPGLSLRELIAGRDWLFDEGNYHIDVSHLSSVVRFARFLDASSPELGLALQMAEYGGKLSSQFQYPADAPFDEYYTAHHRFFSVLLGENRDESLGWFQERLRTADDEHDRQMIAFVLADLLMRIDRLPEALDVARAHLARIDESSGFSLTQLCRQAGRLDVLRDVCRERNDVVGYLAALAADGRTGGPA